MSVEAEMSVLGCMMMDQECARIAVDALDEEMFIHEKTKKIFRVILNQYWESLPIDGVTISGLLNSNERKDAIRLAEYVPTIRHFPDYLRIVKSDWQNREMQKWIGEFLIGIVGNSAQDNIAALQEFVEAQKEISNTKEAITFSQTVQELTKWLRNGKDELTAFSAYRGIDKATGGFLKKTCTALCSRPGGGKTDFAINLLMRMMKRGYKILYFSLEMTRLELMQRIASSITKIDSTKIRDKILNDKEMDTVSALMTSLDQNNRVSFLDDARMTVKDIRHYINVIKPDVAFIDHMGLIQREDTQNAYRALGKISNELKRIAKESDISLINLVQLNREIESRKGKEPQLSDIRESGDIEQDSDYVMFIQPEEDMSVMSISGDGWVEAKLYLKKNRHGKTGVFPFHWKPQYHTYTEVETKY